MRDLGVTFDQFLNFDDHITAICRSTYFHIRNIGKIRNLLSYNACSSIIHALISCRLDYCNSLLYNVPTHKTDRLQRLQNQCARILTKSPRREHITPVLKSLHWLKIQDRITYKILMLTYRINNNNNNNNNNCLKSNIQCIEIRVQWTVHLGSSHMHVHAVTRVHAVTPKLVICVMYLTSI